MRAGLAFASREAVSPLSRLELALRPWTAFAIMSWLTVKLGSAADQFVATKIGVIMGSFCSAAMGMIVVVASPRKEP